MMKNLKSGIVGAVIGVLVSAVTVGGFVVAKSNTQATKVIAACADSSGIMQLKTSAKGQCPKGQKKITWNSKGPRGPRGATGRTGDAVLATLNCGAGQTIVWSGTIWGCRTETITAQLSIGAFYEPSFCCTTHEAFDTYTANVLDTSCNDLVCSIKIADITDHNLCNVSVYGSSSTFQISIYKSAAGIDLSSLWQTIDYQPIYVDLSCTT